MSHLSNQDFKKLVQTPSNVDSSEGALTFSKLSSKQKLNAMRQEIQKEENIKKSKKGTVKKQYVDI